MRRTPLLLALLAFSPPVAVGQALTAWAGQPPLRRHAEVQSYGTRGDETAAIWLMILAEDPRETWDLRAAAALALGRSGSADAPAVLGAMLKDRNPALRFTAALALADSGVAGVETETARALAEDDAWQVRWALARSLGRHAAARGAREALALAARKDPFWRPREQAQRSLKKDESRETAGLAAVLAEKNAEMRGAAVLALASLGGGAARELLEGALEKETDPYLRRLLVDALGRAKP